MNTKRASEKSEGDRRAAAAAKRAEAQASEGMGRRWKRLQAQPQDQASEGVQPWMQLAGPGGVSTTLFLRGLGPTKSWAKARDTMNGYSCHKVVSSCV